jgi:cytochrome c553
MPAFADLLGADDPPAGRRRIGFATAPRARAPRRSRSGAWPTTTRAAPTGDALPRPGCPACHGERGHGDGASAAQLRASDNTPIRPADLTRPWTFKGGGAARDLTTRFAAGIGGTPMPSYLDAASTAQLWDVAHFVGSLARAPSLRDAAVAAARIAPGEGEPPAARGEYLAKSGTCFLCHAQMQDDGGYVASAFGVGGMRVELTHMGRVYTRNLTPDPDTGLGRWSAADLGRALRAGRTPSGRALSPLDMPWPIFADLADRDVEALHAYLHSLAPVRTSSCRPSRRRSLTASAESSWHSSRAPSSPERTCRATPASRSLRTSIRRRRRTRSRTCGSRSRARSSRGSRGGVSACSASSSRSRSS